MAGRVDYYSHPPLRRTTECSGRWRARRREGTEARWVDEWQPEVPPEERVVAEEATEWGIA